MAESQRSDWTATNIAYLALMTFGYIFCEIAHFLINTTSIKKLFELRSITKVAVE